MRPLIRLLNCALILTLLVSMGCSPDARLRAQKKLSQEQIAMLKDDLRAVQQNNARLHKDLAIEKELTTELKDGAELLRSEFDNLAEINTKLAERLSRAGPLPQELDDMLSAFAEANAGLLSYDPLKGRIRLLSDVTFDIRSDEVKGQSTFALAALAQICSAEQAQDCQVLIVGHTDDVPIVRPQTKAKHPTNWHLSVHRAIAVMKVLKKSMPEDRLAVMGFGEFKPIAENDPNKQGNRLNRRVEIFIVPKDIDVPSAGLK